MYIDKFLWTLPYMLWGMLGIFTIMIILIISVVILNFFTKDKSGK
jgi:uncharacterized SAM-binding protein YcdF (DUF218 family)